MSRNSISTSKLADMHFQVPQQDNYVDCGVFVLCNMLSVAFSIPLFTAQTITFVRNHLAMQVVQGTLDPHIYCV